MPLTNLRDESAFSLNFAELLTLYQEIEKTINVTEHQAKQVEKVTQSQADSKIWFHFRAGRITASKMKAACHTNPAQPSQSLVKSICYPDAHSFSAATNWGCSHEKQALECFQSKVAMLHDDVKILSCGLFISLEFPFIGASPDAIMSCACCGSRVVEVKCPFCKRKENFLDASEDKKIFL